VGAHATSRLPGFGQWLKQREARNERSTPVANDLGSKQFTGSMAGNPQDRATKTGDKA
jgi:hypothetical protein